MAIPNTSEKSVALDREENITRAIYGPVAAHPIGALFGDSGASATPGGYIATQFNEDGTMGEKLNGAGSAGNPWTTDLTSYNTANTAGKVLKDKLSLDEFIGLK